MIKIFLIETQKIVREGLRVLLEEEADFKVFTYDNKDVKISLIEQFKTDIILISLDRLDDADLSYLDIFNKLNNDSYQLQYCSQIKIIVFASKVNESILNKALQLGCQGYLLKESTIDELKQAIRSVHNGYKHIGNSVFSQLAHFSVADRSPVKVLEKNVVNSQANFQTGLLTTSRNELDFENINFNNHHKEIVPSPSEEPITSITQDNSSEFKRFKWLRNFSSYLILISLGCGAGIIGFVSVRELTAKSFAPITKYGLVNGEMLVIKSTHSATVKQLNFKVGDRVKAASIIAKLEPKASQKSAQFFEKIEQEVDKIQQQINQEKQLLSIDKFDLISERQKLQQLIAENTKIKSILQSEQDKLKIASRSPESELREEVKLAFTNYQKLQKLKQQQAASQQEVNIAKKAWKTAQNNLFAILNNHSQKFSNNLKNIVNAETLFEENIEYLQGNIEELNIQLKDSENKIKYLSKNLEDTRNRLVGFKNNYLEQQQINIKAPTTGVVYQIYNQINEFINEDQTIAELVNCHNLWVEVIVDANILEKINFKQPALLNLDNRLSNMTGTISSIELLQSFARNHQQNLIYQPLSLKFNLVTKPEEQKSLYKIKINFSIPNNYAQQYKMCGIEKTAMVVFNN